MDSLDFLQNNVVKELKEKGFELEDKISNILYHWVVLPTIRWYLLRKNLLLI